MFNWFKKKNKEKESLIKEDTINNKDENEQIPEENSKVNEEIFSEANTLLDEEKNLDLTEEIDNKENIEEDRLEKTSNNSVEVKEEIEENSKIEEIKEEIEAENSSELDNDEAPNEDKGKVNFFKKLMSGLDKTRKEVGIKINTVMGNYVKIDDDMLEDLEDILISADVGMDTTMKLIDNLRETIIKEKINDPSKVKDILKSETKKLMNEELNKGISDISPSIILVVGVNGVGKTTTIGKLAKRYKDEGKSVLIAAADTFRAAAIDQLKEWGSRVNVDVISHSEGQDPAAVVFDAITAAKSRNADILIVDTAGRLHNKANLMKELEKINRIIDKKYPEAYRETLLVLDATTGQNAMNQAKTFKEAVNITGIALTKLDGTAKGGVVIALQSELQIPIKLVGVGEGIYDLQDFNLDNFLQGIFG
ncbi:signal recognition particle-docking protein FtsY [Peptoniphilus lacrimalis]|uniref:signal recognition particle-docking protein FtsY n=1 Tax=Peptoniphilus lacrimalis TaxID=33031 RepID=UPI00254CD927|nr:signal recognition particle-docking protein FtsY [Peptoniphilus lacrimalis]MDK7721434.1 signal recognition particle-docking protein FtsY [Peptoniphilus lacrimalis]MDK7731035.1 signal recognition particle-docking protein FtsY [Peptoniphilus lacrimalis]